MTIQIRWTGSMTTARTVRLADDPEVDYSVSHIAHFDIAEGVVPDMKADHSKDMFAAEKCQAVWHDGVLDMVTVTGHQRLRSGRLSPLQRQRTWRDPKVPTPVDRSVLPGPVADALFAYELEVADTRAAAVKS